ncbi:GNAT family N-acetyltransferase [Fertoebacter nigrum]|uniref:GNAT family N-acetyltransferase n=1 Tax=Fertoeibacter niger TaxID=2656921 RepID=A0A8X8GZG9_9RHOB|nr:GNAT family N-acetyltransferase [Fertoeibacter niger]NUB44276.1 GNAT family N-acetyltransferase [Fertoeibacter niger]
MMRAATPDDLPALLALLHADVAGSMFPLANLAAEGLSANGLHGMRVWLAEKGGTVVGMLGLTRAGGLLPQWPQSDWAGVRAALAGHDVTMIVGRGAQVPLLRRALGLEAVPARHDDEEPGYQLDLADLILPEPDGSTVEPLTVAHRAVVLPWRAAYLTELFALPADEAASQAAKDVDGWIEKRSHCILMRGGVALAMSGFNARLPDVVQVGGVYTPPAVRGQGLARRVVGGHLAWARAQGAQRAVLFAANDAAAAAYRAIGFQRQGSMAIVQFHAPQRITA